MSSDGHSTRALAPNHLRTALRRLLDAKKEGYALVTAFLVHLSLEGLKECAKALTEILRSGETSPETRHAAFTCLYNIQMREPPLMDVIRKLLAETCEKLIKEACRGHELEARLKEPMALIELHVAHGGEPKDAGVLDAIRDEIMAGNEIATAAMRTLGSLGVFGVMPIADGDEREAWLRELCSRAYLEAAKRAEATGHFGIASSLRTQRGEVGTEVTQLYERAYVARQPIDPTYCFNEWRRGPVRYVRPLPPPEGREWSTVLRTVFDATDLKGHPLLLRKPLEGGGREEVRTGYTLTDGVITVENPAARLIVERLLAHGRWAETVQLMREQAVRDYAFDRFGADELVIPALFEAQKQGRLAVAAALGQMLRQHNLRTPFSPRDAYGNRMIGQAVYHCAQTHFREQDAELHRWEREVCQFDMVEHNPMDGGSSSWSKERITPRPQALEEEFTRLDRERTSWMNKLVGHILTTADELMEEVIDRGLALELHLS